MTHPSTYLIVGGCKYRPEDARWHIERSIAHLVAGLLYDMKIEVDLPVGLVKEMVDGGYITTGDMIDMFSTTLERHLKVD